MELSAHDLLKLVSEVARLASIKTLIQTGTIKPFLKKAEAYRLYERRKIEKWISDGLLTPRKDGNQSAAWRLDRFEIELLASGPELLRLLPDIQLVGK